MIKLLRGLGPATLGVLALTATAAAQGYPPYPAQSYPAQGYPGQAYPAQNPPQNYPPQQSYPGQSSSPQPYPAQGYPAQNTPPQPAPASAVCVRLEAQLASLNGSAAASARADQIKRDQDAIAKQQADLDRTLAQAHRVGCEGEGFFALFSGFSPRCGPLSSQIQQMRGNLDNMMSDLQQLQSGSNDQEGQRAGLIGQLAQNNCGAQYTAAARASGPQGFFEALLGGGSILNPGGNGAPAGTYRTVCVRTCDGYFFPMSYSTVPSRFSDDAQACQRMCPAAEVSLFTYRNPGEEIEQAVSSVNGAPYTALPNAFRYRKEMVAGCSCRKPGETWADALRNADDSTTLESGDIVVTDKNAKLLSQAPRGPAGKPVPAPGGAPGASAAPAAQDPGTADTADTDPKNRKVRVVGPPFMSGQ
jgi:hypothetical protein